MLNYTEAQRAAIDERERSVIVIAGAGSSKTRVLVDRFVGLLADHPEWPVSALVAITQHIPAVGRRETARRRLGGENMPAVESPIAP